MARQWRVLIPALLLFALPGTAATPADPAGAPGLAAALEHFHARRDAEARTALEAIVRRDPLHAEALYYLGRLAKRQQDWKTTAAFYERAAQADPRNALYWADLGEALGMQAQKAGIFQQLGLAKRCREALERAVALEPDNLDYRLGLLSFYRQAPAIAGGGFDKAHAQAEAIRRLDPYRGALAAGSLFQREEKWAEAEAAYREAAEARPDEPDPQLALGHLHAVAGRPEAALQVYAGILERWPGHPAALYQLGRVAASSGLWLDRGEEALRAYLDLPARPPRQPSPAAAWLRLGNIAEKRGHREDARAAYARALELDPTLKEAREAAHRVR